jgi:1-acyl-sn-glycerol-3-phosphate acyltransferase
VPMPPTYPLPRSILITLLAAVVMRRKLSFHKIAISCTNLIDPPLKIYGRENVPAEGGYVLTINHYTRPGFGVWWVPLTASSVINKEVHWIQANAWRMSGWQRPFSSVTRWLFPRVARVFSFIPMPPIPPDPQEAEQRAQAVREVLTFVRLHPQAIIGLAPEGSDEEQFCLKRPPPGTGRFLYILSRSGMEFLPAGFFEEGETVCVRFGNLYQLYLPEGLRNSERDEQVMEIIMSAIAAQLPRNMWGSYDPYSKLSDKL